MRNYRKVKESSIKQRKSFSNGFNLENKRKENMSYVHAYDEPYELFPHKKFHSCLLLLRDPYKRFYRRSHSFNINILQMVLSLS